jgi:hypothetical protein
LQVRRWGGGADAGVGEVAETVNGRPRPPREESEEVLRSGGEGMEQTRCAGEEYGSGGRPQWVLESGGRRDGEAT